MLAPLQRSCARLGRRGRPATMRLRRRACIVPGLAARFGGQSRFASSSPFLSSSLRGQSRFSSSSPPPSSSELSDRVVSGDGETDFGFQTVAKSAKAGLVAEVFHNVASQYDKMNDAMSLGVHRLWKERLLDVLDPQPGARLLDVAGGTGDVAFRFIERMRALERQRGIDEVFFHSEQKGQEGAAAARSSVVVCDINASMLGVGEERAVDAGFAVVPFAEHGRGAGGEDVEISFVEGDAERLPFEDESFDAYTISFGLRNVTQRDRAAKEAWRVLKPGGRFLCLEFSHPHALIAPFYDAYSFRVIPLLGEVLAGDRASYNYLVESIRNFPTQEELCELLTETGFKRVAHENLTGGIVALHSGFKMV